jgi:hypothetical protein
MVLYPEHDNQGEQLDPRQTAAWCAVTASIRTYQNQETSTQARVISKLPQAILELVSFQNLMCGAQIALLHREFVPIARLHSLIPNDKRPQS